VNNKGNVVGVVAANLSVRAALATSGSLPENVNYAVKRSYTLSLLESVPEASARLKTFHAQKAHRKMMGVCEMARPAGLEPAACGFEVTSPELPHLLKNSGSS